MRDQLTDDSSCGSTITINDQFVDVLCDRITADQVGQGHFRWLPGSDTASGKVRTTFLLAVTLVHELCHAIVICHTPCDPATGLPPDNAVEPFYGDQRLAEIGYAWESHVFRGAIAPLEMSLSPAAPYGLERTDWPGSFRIPPERRSPARYGTRWASIHLLRNKYVQDFFTRRFWNGRIDRYGMSGFRPKKRVGFRVMETRGLDRDEFMLPTAVTRPECPEFSDVTDKSDTDDPEMRPDGIFIRGADSDNDSEDEE